MSRLSRIVAVALIALTPVTAAFAGAVGDFESSLRRAYADYRAALFFTNAGNGDKAAASVTAFKDQWAVLTDGAASPPQYADDAAYAATAAEVSALADKAAAEIAAGQLAEAHETLEGVREEIAALHERNGVISFSDRMNAYHARMEEILMSDHGALDAAALGQLREEAAVLVYLAGDIARHPPAEAGEADFAPLLAAMETSATALLEAARAGDAAATASALKALKPAYSKFFLKFG
ncbi:MAG: hypothetical protein KDK07_20960 [Bauldia sp.]|nr:hypothetical protein [Bauldia sp.]